MSLARRSALALLLVTAVSIVLAGPGPAASAGRRKPPAPTAPAPSPTPASSTVLFKDGFEAFQAGEVWADETRHGSWRAIYNGYGTVGVELDGSKALTQAPKASTSSGETHASLVVTYPTFADSDLSVRVRPVAQLRQPAPNAWETGWVIWRYSDDTHFYYFVPKPNGWELGKEDPAYPGAQRFLATGSSPTFPVGGTYTVRVRQVGSTMTVWVNGSQVTSFTDNERPYGSGAVGLYNEDAHVHFDEVTVSAA